MSNQTEIKNALFKLPEVAYLPVIAVGITKLRPGKWATIGKYWTKGKSIDKGMSDITGLGGWF